MVAVPTRTVLRKPEVELGDYLCGGQADRIDGRGNVVGLS